MGIEPPQMVLQVYFTGSSTLIRFNYIVQFSQTGRLAVTIGNDELFDSVYRMDQKPGTPVKIKLASEVLPAIPLQMMKPWSKANMDVDGNLISGHSYGQCGQYNNKIK